eukprot:7306990-Prorocentrum_lima.AAC.1
MWIRKDGVTRGSAPFAIEAIDWSHAQEEDFDLVDLDEEEPLMAHSGQLDGVAHDDPEEQDLEPSNRQE